MKSLIASLLLLGSSLASGEDGTKAPAVFEVLPVKTPRLIGSKLVLHCRLTGLSEKATLVQSIAWEPGEALWETRPEALYDKDGKMTYDPGWIISGSPGDPHDPGTENVPNPSSLTSGQTFRYDLVMPSTHWSAATWRGLLFFNGGKVPITVVCQAGSDANEPLPPFQKTIEVEFLPSPLALILGGLTGSLILAVFERLVRLHRRLSEDRWPGIDDGLDWAKLRRSGVFWIFTQSISGVVQFLVGGLAVAIFLILVGTTQDKDLPVNFKVSGFLSAMAVGFLTHMLVDKLYQRFKQPAAREATPPKPDEEVVEERAPARAVEVELVRGPGVHQLPGGDGGEHRES